MAKTKTPIKAKKEDRESEFALGYVLSSPLFVNFDKKIPDYLIKKGTPKNLALVLTLACITYERIGVDSLSATDEENYDHCIGIYNEFRKRGNSFMKSALLTITYLEHHFIGSFEDAEKEYNKLEKLLKDIL